MSAIRSTCSWMTLWLLALSLRTDAWAVETPVSVPMLTAGRVAGFDAHVTDSGSWPFVLDPGNETLLSRRLVGELGLAVHVTEDGDSVATVDSLRIGDVVLRDVTGRLWDAAPMTFGSFTPGGILGLHLFEDDLVTLDFARRRLIIEEGVLDAGGADVLSFELNPENALTIPVELAGVSFDARMDAGVVGGVALPERFRQRVPVSATPARVGRALKEDGTVADILRARCDGSLRIGRNAVENPSVDFSDAFDEPMLGFEALTHFVITFDQRNGLVRFHPDDGYEAFLRRRAATVREVAGDGMDLRTAFNRDVDRVRLVTILSPT